MDEHVLHLTDGSTIEAKVNFATLYYLEKSGLQKYAGKQPESFSDEEKVELAAKMIYILLRSNGRNVSEEEAMLLAPVDVAEGSEFAEVFEDFRKKLEDYSKKVAARQALRKKIASQ